MSAEELVAFVGAAYLVGFGIGTIAGYLLAKAYPTTKERSAR
jgi:hypothetical protein